MQKGKNMIDMIEMVNCIRAIELLHYGVDITKLDTLKQYWNIKEKKLQSKLSGNIGNFICQIDDKVANFISWPLGKFFERRGQEFSAVIEETEPVNCTVDLDTFKKVMTILKIKQWCKFSNIRVEDYDSEYQARLKKMKAEWNYHDISEASMVQELSHDAVQDNLHCMLTFCKYGKEATEAILKQYNNSPKSFEIDALKDYEVIPICPEIMGGLPTPRIAAEQLGSKVITEDGRDVTSEFEKGAKECLFLANSVKEFAKLSTVCKKIAKEVKTSLIRLT